MVDRPERPNALGLRSYSHEPPQFSSNASVANLASASMSNLSLADLPSPRAGDAPPALSPLDQLALQGRLLAKRFEQADKSGRRLSRLAPLTIQNEFGNRSGYFSSLSSTAGSPNEDLGPISAGGGGVAPSADMSPRQHVSDKHRSYYPQISNDDSEYDVPALPARSPLRTIGEASPAQGYFDIPRTRSPDAVDIGVREATPISPMAQAPTSQLFLSPQRKPSSDSMPRSHPRSNLLPPRKASNHSQRSPRLSPSLRSVHDSSDEVDDMPLSGSYDSIGRNRALSPSSSLSRAQSPFTTTMPRSPSAASDHSLNGLPRPAFNFSRPISRQSTRPSIDCVRPSMDSIRPSLDMPSRQPSDESVFMRPSCDSNLKRQDSNTDSASHYANDTIHTPISMVSEDFRRSGDYSSNPAPSYLYSTFDLPRGRKVDRKSIGIDDFFKREITWDHSKGKGRPPSPDSPPRSFDKDRSPQAPSLISSNDTIRAATAGAAEVTAQQHCDMGVQLHEKGELLKSTYHLRLAARGGLPEAMLWYGLACRHGWGMRENKAEALQWLRRAVDSGHLEIADDEQGQSTDIAKKKQHRAQYAVAIYELGKCYMNGWGAKLDKTLALRCYEIAGNWGDPDALVEAGYCYAQGVGCKKDMKKAAKFYRAAEAKGVSMVGNSWSVISNMTTICT